MTKLLKFKKNATYIFTTLTGKKEHTFKVIKKYTHENGQDIKIIGSLDGQSQKAYFGKRKEDKEYIIIEHWQSCVLSTDKQVEVLEDNQSEGIRRVSRELGQLLHL